MYFRYVWGFYEDDGVDVMVMNYLLDVVYVVW